MAERRRGKRKAPFLSQERRHAERRESPRVPMTFLIRDPREEKGTYEEREGDLSLGGIWWRGKYPPVGRRVELRFRLPGVAKEVTAEGEIIRLSYAGQDLGFHVRFTRLDIEDELAVAKFIADSAETST